MSSGFETNKITIVLHSFNLFGVLCLGWQPNISKLSEEEPSALLQVGEHILPPAVFGRSGTFALRLVLVAC
jgi:hypothetical protein